MAYLLLHDIGNIVKLDFHKLELYDEELDAPFWKKRQDEIIARTGETTSAQP